MPHMSSRGGAAHVATTRRIYKGRVYETHLLRRSFRQDGKVRSETLGNLSHLPAEVIDIVRRSLRGESFSSSSESFEIIRSLPHGHIAAVLGTPPGLREMLNLVREMPDQESRRELPVQALSMLCIPRRVVRLSW